MKPHKWETELIDGGHVGSDDFWICHQCGASGGPVWTDYLTKQIIPGPSMGAFVPGPAIDVSESDCEAAKVAIDKLAEKYPDPCRRQWTYQELEDLRKARV